jgi:hypothetical protein
VSRVTARAMAALIAIGSAMAADNVSPDADVGAWNSRAAQMRDVCTANEASPECVVAVRGVLSDMARAVLVLSYNRDRDVARAAVRKVLGMAAPELRTSAAYALARLGPEEQDTSTLVALLNDPIPSLRRAAWGALSASPDPAAREWVARAKPQARGDRYVPDRRSVDAASLEILLPPGSSPVWFEMAAWREDGAQIFTADGTPDDVLKHFADIANAPVRPLAEVAAWFPGDEKVAKAMARYGNEAWFRNARVVALADGTGDNAGKPVRLAVVWEDVLFGKTGFALQWVPANAMPGHASEPWKGEEPMPQALDASALGDPGSLAPDWRKPEADPIENEIVLQVRLSGGIGALDYLEEFPEGHYRAEVEAILALPRIGTVEPVLVDPTEIRLRFANMPTDRPIRFAIAPRPSAEQVGQMTDAILPSRMTEEIIGQADGEVVWKSDTPLNAGLYVISAYFGPFEMEFDEESLRKYLPGNEAQVTRVFRVYPRIVNLATEKTDYAPDEPVLITYSDMPPAGSPGAEQPLITIVPEGAPVDDWLQYVYTREKTEGTVTINAPAAPGPYQVRALFNGVVHGVAVINVTGASGAPPAATPAPQPDGSPTPAPPASESDIVISLAKPGFAPGEPIVVSVSGLPGNAKDWIAVVPKAEADGVVGQWVYSGGAREGTFTLPGQPAGAYEIRIRYNDEYTPVRARLAFEVK